MVATDAAPTETSPWRTRLARGHQRRRWDERAESWDHGGAPGLQAVVEAVLEQTHLRPGAVVVDLGCGTGSLSLPLARQGAEVTAVDLSANMLERLSQKAAEVGIDGIRCVTTAVETFQMPPASVDLVVSNYALHHLRDRDKEQVVRSIAGWLRPGGRLVIGDMMFGRGTTARDRAIITSKFMALARRGPASWWRLAKNIWRFSIRAHERPVSMGTWKGYLEAAGFTAVSVTPVRNEAAVATGTKPPVPGRP